MLNALISVFRLRVYLLLFLLASAKSGTSDNSYDGTNSPPGWFLKFLVTTRALPRLILVIFHCLIILERPSLYKLFSTPGNINIVRTSDVFDLAVKSEIVSAV